MKDISIGGDPSLGARVIVHIIGYYLLFITMNELCSSFLRTLFSVWREIHRETACTESPRHRGLH
jgi:hypothetical protein